MNVRLKVNTVDGTILLCPAECFLQSADFEAERSTPYDNSGSNSGDQFKPAEHPESEDEDDLEDEVEHEDVAKSEPTAKSKKGKLKPKLGRKDIIATRKTHATAGTPSTGTATVKSGTHASEKEGNLHAR